MKVGDKIKVYQRQYDNPKNKDGSDKPNEFIGEFEVEKIEFEDFYNEKWFGKKDGDRYLIQGHEVSGFYHPNQGGVKFEVTKI